MRLIPRSLLWRSFLLIGLLLLASITTWLLVFDLFERTPRARQTGQMLVSVVNLTRAALINADPLLRVALLRDLSEQEGLRIYPADVRDRITPLPSTQFFQIMQEQVSQQLGPRTRLAAAREGVPGLWVRFQIDPDDAEDLFWVMLPSDRFERVRTLEWLGWTIAALLLALGGAYLIVRHTTQPLSRVTRAAREVGRGELPSPLPEEGPEELAEVSRAFNQMSVDLAQLESDRALILAGISHDLRTPLARLRLGIEMSGAPPEEVDAMSADIEEMDRIIAQFLDFARGSAEEAPVPVDATTLLAEIESSYQRRGLPVAATLPGQAQEMAVRPKALRRALTNLVDNALRYAGTEQNVELALERVGHEMRLMVMDRGPGIPVEHVERLKRPFTRLEAARTDARGSGLGLAIVNRVARLHGGHLELLPRPGGGLLAVLALPTGEQRSDRYNPSPT